MATRNLTVRYGDLVAIACKKEGAVQTDVDPVPLCVGGVGDKPEHEPTRRKAPMTCEHCGVLPPGNQGIVKGYPLDGGGFAILTTDEVAEAKATYTSEYKGEISLVAHPAAEFFAATAPGDSVSYLTPATDSVAGQYATMAAFIESHPELAFVGLNTPGSVTALFHVTSRNGTLVMEKRVRSQSLKPAPKFDAEPMAKLVMFLDMTLEDSLTPYDANAYEDHYKMAIEQLAEDTARFVADPGKVGAVSTPVGNSDADLLAKLDALSTLAPKKPAKKAAKKTTKKEVAA
jgi:non-homologous end joining protein Ku